MRSVILAAAGVALFVRLILLLIFTPVFLYLVAGSFDGPLAILALILAYGLVIYLWIKLIQRFLEK